MEEQQLPQQLLTLRDSDAADENNGNQLEPALELEVPRSPASDSDGNTMLDPITDLSGIQASNVSVDSSMLDTMGIYVERPDGSPVRIAFLTDIDGDQQMFPLLSDATEFEPTVMIEELNGELVEKDQEMLSTFVNAETSQQLSAIRTQGGQILYYIESFPSPDTLPGDAKDQTNNRTMLYSLLNKSFNLQADQQLSLATDNETEEIPQTTDSDVANKKMIIYAKKAKTKRVESSVIQIGSDLPIEEKIQVLESMLPPKPAKKVIKRESEEDDGQVYNCDMCSASFTKAFQLYGHSHTHTSERELTCKYCKDGKVFSAHAKLSYHERRYHHNVRRHACSECGARFERASQLDYHRRRIHLAEKRHACSICCKAFFKMSDLRGHVNIHLGLNSKVCDVCGRKFNHISNLNRHMRTHSGVKPYLCATCGRRFNQLSGLANHALSHETERPAVCAVCGKAFKHSYVMRRHLKIHHKDVLEGAEDLSKMLQLKSGAQTRRYYCAVCGERFQFSVLLKRHERQHEKQKNFPCLGCNQILATLDQLKTHCCRVAAAPDVTALNATVPDATVPDVTTQEEYSSQLRSLLGYPAQTEGNSSGDFIIYVLQEGHEHPTQVHIRAATAEPSTVDYDESGDLIHRMQESDMGDIVCESEIPVTHEEMQDYTDTSTLQQLDVTEAGQQKPRVNTRGYNRTKKIPKRTKKVHLIITKDVPFTKRDDNDDNTSQVDMKDEVPYPVNIVQSFLVNAKHIGVVADEDKSVSVNAQSSSENNASSPSGNIHATISAVQGHGANCSDLVISSAQKGAELRDVNEASAIEDELRDVTTSTFSLSDVTLGLMKLNPSKIEEAPTSPLLSLALSDTEVSQDRYFPDRAGDLQGEENENEYEDSIDPMSLFKPEKTAGEEKAVDVTITVLAGDNGKQTAAAAPKKQHKKMFECPECHKIFTKNGNFKQHIAMHFVDQQRYRCTECGQCFAWKSTLTKHVLRHGAPRQKIACLMCHKEYALQSQVQQHIKRDHLKERPHVCSVCEKTFYKKHDLTIHLRTHTQEKPYMCKKCGRQFYHPSHIIRHEMTHTGAKPFSCADCGKAFTQASSLKVHRQSANRCMAKVIATVPPSNDEEEEDLALGDFRMPDDDNIMASFAYHDGSMPRDEF